MADTLKFSAGFAKGATEYHVVVNIVQFKDSGSYVLFAPAMEVYGYGRTVGEARSSFEISMKEFLSYSDNKGTLLKELTRLGWEVKGGKKNRKFKVPEFSDLLRTNDRLMEILNNRDVRTFKANVPMAIPA
jgi:hypothetical protein